MQTLDSSLDKLASSINQLEKKRTILGDSISEIKDKLHFPFKDSDILEENFVSEIEPHSLKKIRVSAVDGGVVQSRYHGASLVVGRAAAVVFDFKGGELVETEYYPDSFPSPTPISFLNPISSREFLAGTSIERSKLEISTAFKAIEKYKPDVMLLDGSIIPHGMTRPEKSSEVYESYKELIEMYIKLYDTARKNNTLLAGVVEDSSGLRLTHLLKEKVVPGIIESNEFSKKINTALESSKDILDKTNDSNTMYHILDTGERSCVFTFSKDPKKHRILHDLDDWAESVNSFYLKSVEFDRPVRIDFLNRGRTKETADKIASVVYALSRHNETYGCPSILIEADARAKLSEKDMDIVYQRLKDKVGDVPSLFKLRREFRPF
ncbi:MAG: DNA double-strand break repair nuclease NurA [Candidatus Undinarchaeales archaeon]